MSPAQMGWPQTAPKSGCIIPLAALLNGSCVLRLSGNWTGFGPEKSELIRVILDLLVDAYAGRMPTVHAVVQQDGAAAS